MEQQTNVWMNVSVSTPSPGGESRYKLSDVLCSLYKKKWSVFHVRCKNNKSRGLFVYLYVSAKRSSCIYFNDFKDLRS